MYEFLMRFQSIDQCHQVFAKVLRMESMSLLELALWKAKICADLTFSSMHEMREYPILERTFNVSSYLYETRLHCGAQVVLPLVQEFLGPIGTKEIPSKIFRCLFVLNPS